MNNKKVYLYTIIFLVLLAAFFTKWPAFQKPSEQEQLKAGLELGQLADLPKNATDIKVASKGSTFSKTVYISFKSTSQDIESFIQGSEGLKNVQSQHFDYSNKPGDNYFAYSDGAASWFSVKTKKATLYEIPQNKDANYGTVIIDEAADTVYIRTSHS